jgi:hypothetical protein
MSAFVKGALGENAPSIRLYSNIIFMTEEAGGNRMDVSSTTTIFEHCIKCKLGL